MSHPTETEQKAAEVLAMRLILAYMTEDPDERAFYVWSVMAESCCNTAQFEIAARVAREAASWWLDSGRADKGRAKILAKIEELTPASR